jgi:hypothetical protein
MGSQLFLDLAGEKAVEAGWHARLANRCHYDYFGERASDREIAEL